MPGCKQLRFILPVAVMLAGITQSEAAPVNIEFTGTLIVPPPCSINNSEEIVVDFGSSLGVNSIDGLKFKKTLPGPIVTCETGAQTTGLSIKLSGTEASFEGGTVIATQSGGNTTDLGVRLYVNSNVAVFGTAYPVNVAAQPVIDAVPVKRAGATLTPGRFDAIATLEAVYD